MFTLSFHQIASTFGRKSLTRLEVLKPRKWRKTNSGKKTCCWSCSISDASFLTHEKQLSVFIFILKCQISWQIKDGIDSIPLIPIYIFLSPFFTDFGYCLRIPLKCITRPYYWKGEYLRNAASFLVIKKLLTSSRPRFAGIPPPSLLYFQSKTVMSHF